jgi:hypothetical protein
VLPVNGMPRFAIVFVIGDIAAAAPVLLPKIDGIGPTPPPVVVVAFVAVVIVDRILFDIICTITEYLESICVDVEKMSRFKSIVQSRTCGKVHSKMRLTQSTQ